MKVFAKCIPARIDDEAQTQLLGMQLIHTDLRIDVRPECSWTGLSGSTRAAAHVRPLVLAQ